MSGDDWLYLLAGISIGTTLGLITSAVRYRRALREPQHPNNTPERDKPWLHAHIEDWGPGFNEGPDALGQWRWSLWDADHHDRSARESLTPPVVGKDVPHLVGNAYTLIAAREAALNAAASIFGREGFLLKEVIRDGRSGD